MSPTTSIATVPPISRLRAAATACARDLRKYAGSASAVVGVGAVACAACCALPILFTTAGLGAAAAGVGAAAGAIEPYLAGGTAMLALFVPLGIWARRRALASSASKAGAVGTCGCAATTRAINGSSSVGAICAVDRSCGGQPPAAATRACTLADTDVGDRLADLRAAFAGLTGSERPDARELVLRFRDEGAALARVEALARAERACCSFLESEVDRIGGEVRWRIRGGPGTEPAIAMFEELPRRVASGMTDSDARALLARMNDALRG